MNRNPGKGGPIIIVDGTPKSGVSTLAEALWQDLGVLYHDRRLTPQLAGNFDALRDEVQSADHQPILMARFLLTAAGHMGDPTPGQIPLTAQEWGALDDMCARRNARVICLLDNPASIESRMRETGPPWDRERIGRWLESVNRAFAASSIARKGSYLLPQFLHPTTGARTDQYHRLVGVLRGEIEAARCQRAGAELLT